MELSTLLSAALPIIQHAAKRMQQVQMHGYCGLQQKYFG